MRNKYGYVPKKRNSNTRKRKSIMLIVAEGENRTETNYFRSFPSEKYRIRFVSGNDTDPIRENWYCHSKCQETRGSLPWKW